MRASWCVGAALAASVWSGAAQAQARYAQDDGYGGGLIEYLVTGNVAAHGGTSGGGRTASAARSGYAPAYGAAARSGDPIEAYGGASQAYAALPAQAGPPVEADRIARAPDPRYARQDVAFPGHQRPGTIVIDTPAKFLYLVQPGGRAMRYGIGVGASGVRLVRPQDGQPQGRVAGLDAAAGDAGPPAGPAAPHGGRARQSPRGAGALPRLLALPHPRHQRAAHNRPERVVRLHPHDERRRGRPVRAGSGGHARSR